jgi:hypothetical protein
MERNDSRPIMVTVLLIVLNAYNGVLANLNRLRVFVIWGHQFCRVFRNHDICHGVPPNGRLLPGKKDDSLYRVSYGESEGSSVRIRVSVKDTTEERKKKNPMKN